MARAWNRVAGFLGLMLLVFVACQPSPSFPPELEVASSAQGDVQTVPANSGPAPLADSSWALYKAGDSASPVAGEPIGPYGGIAGFSLTEPVGPDDLLIRAEFGDSGQIVRLFDNQFYTPNLLPEIIEDGQLHPAGAPFISYAVVPYGFSEGDRIALASRIKVYLFNLQVADGLAYAWGQLAGDRMDGTIGYVVDIGLFDASFVQGTDQFKFYALRER